MKKIILLIITISICLCSCTEQERICRNGGEMTINLPAGQELMMATWKYNSIFYLTRPMTSDYVPVTKVFQERSPLGVIRTTVYFKESK